jgi:hypothetical protein
MIRGENTKPMIFWGPQKKDDQLQRRAFVIVMIGQTMGIILLGWATFSNPPTLQNNIMHLWP